MTSTSQSKVSSKEGQQKPVVTVIYNGLEKALEYNPHAAVQSLLQHSIRSFGITQNAHLLGLFTTGGVELKDQDNLEAIGVTPGARLLLRPSAVRGGLR